jgi:hypothetical protein
MARLNYFDSFLPLAPFLDRTVPVFTISSALRSGYRCHESGRSVTCWKCSTAATGFIQRRSHSRRSYYSDGFLVSDSGRARSLLRFRFDVVWRPDSLDDIISALNSMTITLPLRDQMQKGCTLFGSG